MVINPIPIIRIPYWRWDDHPQICIFWWIWMSKKLRWNTECCTFRTPVHTYVIVPVPMTSMTIWIAAIAGIAHCRISMDRHMFFAWLIFTMVRYFTTTIMLLIDDHHNQHRHSWLIWMDTTVGSMVFLFCQYIPSSQHVLKETSKLSSYLKLLNKQKKHTCVFCLVEGFTVFTLIKAPPNTPQQ